MKTQQEKQVRCKESEKKRGKKPLWVPSCQLPKNISHFSSLGTVKTSAMLYAIGTEYKQFTAFEEVQNYEERCKLKQSTVSSTGLQMGRPANILYKTLAPDAHSFRQVAPLISVWQESGKLQSLRIMIKTIGLKMIGLKT